jgi:hypothetical protein
VGTAHHRTVTDASLEEPQEAAGVIGIVALGPSGREAFYSNYGIQQADISAHGGDLYDFFGTPQYGTPKNLVLSTERLRDACGHARFVGERWVGPRPGLRLASCGCTQV